VEGENKVNFDMKDDVDNHHKDGMKVEFETEVDFRIEVECEIGANDKGDDNVKVESWIKSEGHDLSDNDDATLLRMYMKVLRM